MSTVFPINSDTTGLMTWYDNVDDDVQALSNGKKYRKAMKVVGHILVYVGNK